MNHYLCAGVALLHLFACDFCGAAVFEAEEFHPDGAWQRKSYGENYYVGTFANTFLSRKAFLGAPGQCDHSEASLTIQVPAPGRYAALVRYEAAYRFETRFTLRVEQSGGTRLERLYGSRSDTKIWAFGKRLTNEVAWGWGASENIVWEGHNALMDLDAGPALLTLIAENQPEPAARRNIDAVMLTTNLAEVQMRIEKEGYLPLDGLLTQEGDLFARVRNRTTNEMILTFSTATEHSPYWVHRRDWKAKTLVCPGGRTSDWMEVGSLLDSLNDGQWHLEAKGQGSLLYDLEVATLAANGKYRALKKFPALTNGPTLAYDADTRYSRRIRLDDDVLYELVDDLKARPVHGVPPRRTLLYGTTFSGKPRDEKYTKAVADFISLMGATAFSSGERRLSPLNGLIRDYIDLRDQSPQQLKASCAKLVAEGRANQIATVSLGDEIMLASPGKNADATFREWAQKQGLSASDLDPSAGNDWSNIHYRPGHESSLKTPGLYYYSNVYRYRYGIAVQEELTDVLRAALPNAAIGANFSPQHGDFYLGETYKWVSVFREGGMTQPWSEDYIFQAPVGSQQMNSLPVDLFRAGIKNNPSARIHYYVMAHWPGNTPASWRRQFYADIAHGVKVFNLFEFRPVQAAYTENHCSSVEMFQAVRQAIHELGTFEDLVQDGQVRPAQAGLWFSEAADIWADKEAPFAAAKRTLYIGIRQQQLPLDVVVEGDDLSGCTMLFLTDRHVSRAASRRIAEWVRAGGRLQVTAGAGMFDEFNQPNVTLRQLIGVEEIELVKDHDPIVFEKQDLPFAKPLATVLDFWGAKMLPVYGAYSRLKAAGASIKATFDNGAPAVTRQMAGNGSVSCLAFLPGLSYFKPALPQWPVDRSSRDDSLAHFIPTNFDAAATFAFGDPRDQPNRLILTRPGVEWTIVDSPHGVLLPLINWSGRPQRKLEVTVDRSIEWKSAVLGSGNKLRSKKQEQGTVFTLDLDVADAIVLRR